MRASAAGITVIERDVDIPTPDGVCDAVLFHPKDGTHPAVIKWTDIIGLRPVFRDMGRRLARHGYTVLVPNPFYRDGRAPLHEPDFDFARKQDRDHAMTLLSHLFAPGRAEDDITAMVSWLDNQNAVTPHASMGTTGYCMGAWLTVRGSALLPERFRAAAAFHPGRMITENPDSPHLLIPKIKAAYHLALAADDDAEAPAEKHTLRKIFDKASIPATIKVYNGANHSWCVPTSAAYNEGQAEAAWKALTDLFGSKLV